MWYVHLVEFLIRSFERSRDLALAFEMSDSLSGLLYEQYLYTTHVLKRQFLINHIGRSIIETYSKDTKKLTRWFENLNKMFAMYRMLFCFKF